MILTVKSTLRMEENLKKEFRRVFESLKGPSFCISLSLAKDCCKEVCCNQVWLSLEGLGQHVALILCRPDSDTKNSVEKCLIFRTSKSSKLVAKKQWKFKEQVGLELCDVASCMRYCHLSLVQMTPGTALQAGDSGCGSGIHLRERRSIPYYLTDLMCEFSNYLCNSLNLKQCL